MIQVHFFLCLWITCNGLTLPPLYVIKSPILPGTWSRRREGVVRRGEAEKLGRDDVCANVSFRLTVYFLLSEFVK